MISRRNVIAGLAAAATTGCSAPQAHRQASVAPDQYPQTPPPQTPPPEYPIAPAPPSRTPQGLDAVIDISAHTTVSDFRLVRASNILAVIHKASEGDFYADPMCAERRSQAEAFVQAVASATGRLPLIYVHPTWANGGARITPGSILARCGLWVVDYHESPTVPRAWATSGWRLWQYASDEYASRRARGRNRIIQGLDRCDRNLFNGDVAALHRFWNAAV